MADLVSAHYLVYPVILVLGALAVRQRIVGTMTPLLGAVAFLAIAIGHTFVSETFASSIAALSHFAVMRSDDVQQGLGTIHRWGVLVPLLFGGLGINWLSTWTTSSPK